MHTLNELTVYENNPLMKQLCSVVCMYTIHFNTKKANNGYKGYYYLFITMIPSSQSILSI